MQTSPLEEEVDTTAVQIAYWINERGSFKGEICINKFLKLSGCRKERPSGKSDKGKWKKQPSAEKTMIANREIKKATFGMPTLEVPDQVLRLMGKYLYLLNYLAALLQTPPPHLFFLDRVSLCSPGILKFTL